METSASKLYLEAPLLAQRSQSQTAPLSFSFHFSISISVSGHRRIGSPICSLPNSTRSRFCSPILPPNSPNSSTLLTDSAAHEQSNLVYFHADASQSGRHIVGGPPSATPPQLVHLWALTTRVSPFAGGESEPLAEGPPLWARRSWSAGAKGAHFGQFRAAKLDARQLGGPSRRLLSAAPEDWGRQTSAERRRQVEGRSGRPAGAQSAGRSQSARLAPFAGPLFCARPTCCSGPLSARARTRPNRRDTALGPPPRPVSIGCSCRRAPGRPSARG